MRVLHTTRRTIVLLVMAVAACDGRDDRSAGPAIGDEPGRSAVADGAGQNTRRSAAAPPDDTVLGPGLPPGATSKVLDIRFPVESLAGRVEGLTVTKTGTEVRLLLAADVLFEFDKADLRPDADAALAQAAALIRERGVGVVRIEGHTDSKGTAAYNVRLSSRRAESVRRSLASRGLSGVTFLAQGLGATRPAAPNTKPDGSDDPEGRARNRRVEVAFRAGPTS